MESTNTSAVGASAPPLEAFEPDGICKQAEKDVAKLGQLPALTQPELGALGMHEPYVRSLVRRTPNWPREGVTFLDMSPLLADSRALKLCVDCMAQRYGGAGITHVAGIDARGFTVGCACKSLRFFFRFSSVSDSAKIQRGCERGEYVYLTVIFCAWASVFGDPFKWLTR